MQKENSDFLNQFNEVTPKLRNYARKLTKDEHEADDLFQASSLRMYRYRELFQAATNFDAWSCTIMRNLFINEFRKKKRRNRIIEPYSESDNNSALSGFDFNDGEQTLLKNDILELVNGLANDFKVPFMMLYEGYKYEEIAKELDKPLGTIKSRIFVARQQLKDKIKKLDAPPYINLHQQTFE